MWKMVDAARVELASKTTLISQLSWPWSMLRTIVSLVLFPGSRPLVNSTQVSAATRLSCRTSQIHLKAEWVTLHLTDTLALLVQGIHPPTSEEAGACLRSHPGEAVVVVGV